MSGVLGDFLKRRESQHISLGLASFWYHRGVDQPFGEEHARVWCLMRRRRLEKSGFYTHPNNGAHHISDAC
jgi:hypothetical protein